MKISEVMNNRRETIVFTIFSAALSWLSTLLLYHQFLKDYTAAIFPSWLDHLLPVLAVAACLLAVLALIHLSRHNPEPAAGQQAFPLVSPKRILAAILCLALVPLLWTLRARVFLGDLRASAAFMVLIWFTLTAFYLVARVFAPVRGWAWSFSLAILGTGFVFSCASFLNQVTDYPFSLGWSEGNRYVNAALVADWFRHGFKGTLPVLHPTRYLLQAIPFLVTSHEIWIHRLWQALLWISIPLLLSLALVRRIHFKRKADFLWWLLLGYLFLQQGPVYYHLALSVLPVIWWYREDKPLRTAFILAVCSAWAGLSRINWYFMPLTVAMLFHLLENPLPFKLNKKTVLTLGSWGLISLLFAAGAKYGYQAISGNPAWFFDTAFSSELLWYRLLPNATFLPGVLPGIFLALLPLGGWMLSIFKKQPAFRWNNLLAGLILAIYFMGSMVVSVKIGGGSNLHNYDSFLVLFLLVSLLIIGGSETRSLEAGQFSPHRWQRMLAAVVPVAILLLMNPALFIKPDQRLANEVIPQLQGLIDEQAPGSQILCLSDCQLFTFGNLKASQVDVRYEKIFLMEMAMAGNEPFLSQLEGDLLSGRYGLIFTDRLTTNTQSTQQAFSEENNSWVNYVSRLVLKYYAPVMDEKRLNLQVLRPVQ